ncbi:serine/threonine-protein kinase [Stieleria sp. JC731]|uniref:serine/threonine-protein kinase n=1 Tax=Pirellulaceae TaxID=2691357 RepID=UPI001E4BF1D9|nr:serine/threonine-protein kinase [Stieleria sp. JC731]MCC9603904.1 serine/threonine-protein kinase [Stieleria sp. JC731]
MPPSDSQQPSETPDDRIRENESRTTISHHSERTGPENREQSLSFPAEDPGSTNVLNLSSVQDDAPLSVGQVVLDRYVIKERLGRGGFGTVFSAHDRNLNRMVAIKQARSLRSFVRGQVREEARKIASLNHPNIVQIYDLVEQGDNACLIVMEYLEGTSLSRYLKNNSITIAQAVHLGIGICDALIHAHTKQLVHSDLKPANLHLCPGDQIKLLDFGLAVAHFPNQGTRIGGTPGYMSPEQIRGESHLIDGRTDIWAFGVVLYQLLTGARPFSSNDDATTNARTLFKLAPPPQQLNPDIDNELQRIVLKCLEPLITSRYLSAVQVREDLLHWSEKADPQFPASTEAPVEIPMPVASVPSSVRLSRRGLQPFSESDAQIYLSLIPGPRDRNNVPDSIRFWNRWIMSNDPQTDHPVGVLFGPSGSGKTSYVRAGLFSQLGPDVCRVYLECRPGDLGSRLTKAIESQIDAPADGSSLRDLLHQLRSGSTGSQKFRKLLIVLDQFESWAHVATLDERLDLAEALRQCDGIQIRALIITRIDYWIGTQELLRWLEVPMQEGRNVASVDLLNTSEAERILEVIGREQRTLPEDGQLSKEQKLFLTQAVNELANDGKVICVHLVMFAEMVRRTNWTPRSLRESGGVSGACSLFFQELFEKDSGHSPEYRRIAPVVPAILAKLTPVESDNAVNVSETATSIRQAAEESGYPHLVNDALRLLSEDLRIISVVGPDVIRSDQDRPEGNSHEVRYRLAHDFLVEPVITFLIRVRKNSWRNRTMTRLVEMSETWSRRPKPVHLPNFTDYLILSFGTVFQRRSPTDARFLRAATRLHAGRISVGAISLLGLIFLSVVTWYQWNAARQYRQSQLNAEVARLLESRSADDFSTQAERLSQFGIDALNQVGAWQISTDDRIKLLALLFEQHIKQESFVGIAPLILEAPSSLFDSVLSVAKKTPDASQWLRSVATAGEESQDGAELDSQEIPPQELRDRAAILLAYLGDRQPLLKRLSASKDRVRDEAFISTTMTWRGHPDLWADIVSNNNDAIIRYYAGTILGGYPKDQLLLDGIDFDFNALVNSKDASVSSIARFLAKHLGKDPLAYPLAPPNDANWIVGPGNIPMAIFEPTKFETTVMLAAERREPAKINTYEVTKPFLVATIPVPQFLYEDFADDLSAQGSDFDTDRKLERWELPTYLTDNPNQPAVAATLSQTFRFCNWLSEREGLTPCFTPKEVEPVADPKKEIPPIPWTYDSNANGYRVLTDDEFWLVATNGYLTTNSALAVEIAGLNTKQIRQRYPRELFALIPNRAGLFLFDRYCGTWITGHPLITGYNIASFGPAPGFSQNYGVPVGGIYLCRTATQ